MSEQQTATGQEEEPVAIEQLEADYNALADEAKAFDPATLKVQRELEAGTKQVLDERKRQRSALLARKLAAFRALDQRRRELGISDIPSGPGGDPTAERPTQPAAPLMQQQPLVPPADALQPPVGATVNGVVKPPDEPPTQPAAPLTQQRPMVPAADAPQPGNEPTVEPSNQPHAPLLQRQPQVEGEEPAAGDLLGVPSEIEADDEGEDDEDVVDDAGAEHDDSPAEASDVPSPENGKRRNKKRRR